MGQKLEGKRTSGENPPDVFFDGVIVTATTADSTKVISLTGYVISASDVGRLLAIREAPSLLSGLTESLQATPPRTRGRWIANVRLARGPP